MKNSKVAEEITYTSCLLQGAREIALQNIIKIYKSANSAGFRNRGRKIFKLQTKD